jgi:type III secretion system YscQ/HrcQ family protein
VRAELESAHALEPGGAAEVFDWLPRLPRRQVQLDRLLAHWSDAGRLPSVLRWLDDETGGFIRVDRPEVIGSASGLHRPSLVVQMTVPRLGARLGVGVEIPLAHAIVDRLLGFDRSLGESRLQLSPVEWGVWTFLALRALETAGTTAAERRPSRPDAGLSWPLEARDLSLDRVGPDAFDPAGQGSIVTVRWRVHVGDVAAAVRLWLAEPLVELWLAARESPRPGPISGNLQEKAALERTRGHLSSVWRVWAGSIVLPRGLGRLRVGGVVPLTETRLAGSAGSPAGPIELILDLDGQDTRWRIAATALAEGGGRRVRVDSVPEQQPRRRDPIVMPTSEKPSMSQGQSAQSPPASPSPLDVPVTLTVELGRVNMTVTQLADLKPGDVVELNRHSRAPVELTSSGRLVARGELILIDTDLGVRITHLYL